MDRFRSFPLTLLGEVLSASLVKFSFLWVMAVHTLSDRLARVFVLNLIKSLSVVIQGLKTLQFTEKVALLDDDNILLWILQY